jgi:ferredoxin-NADP reductase
MSLGQKIVAAQLSGDFTLPKNPKEKLVFIAGGIGVTPFRSMIKYLVDKNEKRDVVMFYSNRTAADIAYKDVFDEAQSRLGIKTIYTLTDKNTPSTWTGKIGYVDANMVVREVPDYLSRTFYLSGPHSMVTAFEQTLKDLGVSHSQIKIDFFPGFA